MFFLPSFFSISKHTVQQWQVNLNLKTFRQFTVNPNPPTQSNLWLLSRLILYFYIKCALLNVHILIFMCFSLFLPKYNGLLPLFHLTISSHQTSLKQEHSLITAACGHLSLLWKPALTLTISSGLHSGVWAVSTRQE